MKKWTYIQVSLVLLLGSILFTKGQNKNTSVTKDQGYRYTRERNYRSYYYPHFRSYAKRYHHLMATVMIREDMKKGQKIIDVMIDGNRVKFEGEKKDILYRLTPGNHIIEWVSSKGNNKKFFKKKFYVDRLEQSVNLLIDGNKFYKK